MSETGGIVGPTCPQCGRYVSARGCSPGNCKSTPEPVGTAVTLPCGHEQQTIEGVALPCADLRCEGSPGGERYKVNVAVDWAKGRSLLFARQVKIDLDGKVPPVWHWQLAEARDVDLAAVDRESRARVLAYLREPTTAIAMVAELEGTLRNLWDQVKDRPWDDTRKSVEKTLAGARELLERTR